MSTSYLDSGFDRLLRRPRETDEEGKMSNLQVDSKLDSVGGQKIAASGTTSSRKGRIKIDWETGTITFNDGATDRIIIGFSKGGF